MRSKCLVQLALAYHLIGKHDEALSALDKVEAKELLEDTEDLRLGILLAVMILTNYFEQKEHPHPSLSPSLRFLKFNCCFVIPNSYFKSGKTLR